MRSVTRKRALVRGGDYEAAKYGNFCGAAHRAYTGLASKFTRSRCRNRLFRNLRIVRRSHGCVNLPLGFAGWLYYWADYGTRIWIHY